MKALTWCGKFDVKVQTVPDPKILNPRDVIIRVTSTAICGSDLHLYDGYIPSLKPGDILGHEFMGEVVETGAEVRRIKKGDRVVVPFVIACGSCWFCKHDLHSGCDNTNANAAGPEKAYGFSPAGLFGYSHMFGGYAGGQAEYVRVPHADVSLLKIPDGLSDEKALFLTDIFPTGYQAAEACNIQPDDTVAVWGAGPVGQFAVRSAQMLGAARVLVIDDVPERLAMAASTGAIAINMATHDVYETILEYTGGRGADACIDAVGLEAHGASFDAVVDRIKVATYLATDRAHALRQAIMCCRKAGTVSVPGVYGGLLDKVPFGAAFGKGLTIKSGQTHVQRYLPRLLERIVNGDIDPSFVITHHAKLADAAEAYATFKAKRDGCIKVVLHP